MKKIAFILCCIIVLLALIFEFYIWIKYGNMPAGEVPAWVMWFMGK